MQAYQAGKLLIAVFIAILAGGVLLQCRPPAVVNVHSCYERAQDSTAFIICPDSSSGSGVVVKRSNRLFLWTAAHVVSDCDTVAVRSYIRAEGSRVGHFEFSASVIARNDKLDVALLWLVAPAEYFDAAIFSDATPLRVGQSVYHVGNFSGGFDDSVSTGVISQIGVPPNIPNWPWVRPLDQTTSFIDSGSSGGGIFRHDNNQLAGILVGGDRPGVSDINVFVPVREILKWTRADSLTWAVYGNLCPADSVLESASLVAAHKRAASLLPP